MRDGWLQLSIVAVAEGNQRGRLMHHVIMIILLLLDVWVVLGWSWCDWASRSLIVTFDIIPSLEELSFWGDWWCHISIDHVAIWLLLRRTREQINI